jgi:hypothetical protein
MAITAQAFSPANGVAATSDVESLEYTNGGLVVVLACSMDENRKVSGIKVTFPRVTGFRLLDELDLVRYWMAKDFPCGSHVLEVKGGGWSSEENIFQTFETARREWLVVSGNACVSVFCRAEPEIAEIKWEFKK